MSKAEDRSKEIIQAALDYANNLDDVKPTDEFRRNLCISLGQAFMKGAEWADSHQAEKDLELTYDDICEIMEIREDVLEMDSYENLYEEILKRFKEMKETKD